MFSGSESLLRFTRKLVDQCSGIPTDASIYDGGLSDAEFKRLANTLVKWIHTPIFINQSRFILEDICEAVMKHQQIRGEIGLVPVDYTQKIMDRSLQLEGKQHSLKRLKKLAGELMVPVIAIYQLDPAEEKHPSTFTRFELLEIERLAAVPDEILFMSGTLERLVFSEPIISKYKRKVAVHALQ